MYNLRQAPGKQHVCPALPSLIHFSKKKYRSGQYPVKWTVQISKICSQLYMILKSLGDLAT
ncbi:hypothetical protein EFT87_13665, partial [Schleiferilactobacillus harbinensis]|uniref:hypothetical protein n=1 Tax=Schleiferilactobacillus harbinensis TaxID=304207 RepID=UPI0021A3756A